MFVAGSESSEQESTFLLQRWSHKWKAFVNVSSIHEILDQDKVTVTRKPVSSPSKVGAPFVLLCVLCYHRESPSSEWVLSHLYLMCN